MANEIKIYYTLYGNIFDPEDISKELNLSPKLTWRKGDKRGKSILFYEDFGWSINTKKENIIEIELSLSKSPSELIFSDISCLYFINPVNPSFVRQAT